MRNTVDFYGFEETGKGCGKHPDPGCLCDVRPDPAGVPIRTMPRLAPLPDDFAADGNSFIIWASTLLGRFEALAGINQSALNDALAMWEGHSGPTSKSHHAAQKVSAAKQCLLAGLTLEQTARWLSTELPLIMDLFYPRSKHELILEMEKMIRSGSTAKEISDALGVTASYACDVARRWNVQLPHSGVRYGPEVKKKARQLVRSGMSRREAARQLGLSETRVATWCRDLPGNRRGRKVSK